LRSLPEDENNKPKSSRFHRNRGNPFAQFPFSSFRPLPLSQKKKNHHNYQLLDLWSNSAILTRLDKRSLQQEADLHRLFLLTEHRVRVREEKGSEERRCRGEEYANTLSAEAQRLGPKGTAAAVQRRLLEQAFEAARALHASLVAAGDREAIAAEEEGKQKQKQEKEGEAVRGLAAAVGGGSEEEEGKKQQPRASSSPSSSSSSSSSTSSSSPPPLALIADRLSASLGYSLRVAESSIPGAGDGVFVAEAKKTTTKKKKKNEKGGNESDNGNGNGSESENESTCGAVEPGTLALLYPGVAYPPLSYRSMAGYPRVDKGSDYLAARYDGIVLDAVAWGRGRGSGSGHKGEEEEEKEQRSSSSSPSTSSPCTAFAPPRPRPEGAPRPTGPAAAAEALLDSSSASSSVVEARNPLALAHLVNHPPPGQTPNVAVASFDVPLLDGGELEREPWLRRYFPVVVVGQGGEEEKEEDHGEKENKEGSFSIFGEPRLPPPPSFLPCLGLVALSRIYPGTEILFNYRLSSKLKKPEWYHAVGSEEESRRWA